MFLPSKPPPQQLSATTDSLTGKTNKLSQENDEMKESIKQLKARVDELTMAGSSEASASTSGNYSRLAAATNANALCIQHAMTNQHNANELSISGLSFDTINEETLLNLTTAIAVAIKAEILPNDLLSARLLRKKTVPPPLPSSAEHQNSRILPKRQRPSGLHLLL